MTIVLSPGDRPSEIRRKTAEYLEKGVPMVVPKLLSYRSRQPWSVARCRCIARPLQIDIEPLIEPVRSTIIRPAKGANASTRRQ